MSTYELSIPTDSDTGLNKYQLFESQTVDARQRYGEVIDPLNGALSTVLDNDVKSKFRNVIARILTTAEQQKNLTELALEFRCLEGRIDPARLDFIIQAGQDGDICVSRRSHAGLSTIILHDDGAITFSFIASRLDVGKTDVFEFMDDPSFNDWEMLTFRFFQW